MWTGSTTPPALVPEDQLLSVNRADVRRILLKVNINQAAGPDNIYCPCSFLQIYSIAITIPIPWFQYQLLNNTFFDTIFIKSVLTKDYTTHYGKNILFNFSAPWHFYRLKAVSYHSKYEPIYQSVISPSQGVTSFFSLCALRQPSPALIDLGSKRKVLAYWLTDIDEINSLHIEICHHFEHMIQYLMV